MKEGITITDSFSKLMLGDYIDIMDICKDDSLEEIDKQVKVISILTGRTEDDILNLSIPEYKGLVTRSRFLEQPLPDSTRLADSYKIGKFCLIPVTDFRKVTTAQYIDFQSFHQAGMEEHIVEILSCLLVPQGKIYNQDYDIIEVQKDIRDNLSVADGLSLYAFFFVSFSDSIKDMLTFSKEMVAKVKDKTKRERILKEIEMQEALLRTNGDGSPM